MSRKKKTYVVSVFVPVTVNALVYAEVIAENKNQAIKDVQKNFDEFNLDDAIVDDATILMIEKEFSMGKISFVADRANQYHGSKECQMCKETKEEN